MPHTLCSARVSRRNNVRRASCLRLLPKCIIMGLASLAICDRSDWLHSLHMYLLCIHRSWRICAMCVYIVYKGQRQGTARCCMRWTGSAVAMMGSGGAHCGCYFCFLSLSRSEFEVSAAPTNIQNKLDQPSRCAAYTFAFSIHGSRGLRLIIVEHVSS